MNSRWRRNPYGGAGLCLSVLVCGVVVAAACGRDPQGEFQALSHGVIEVTVVGASGQPLDSIAVTLTADSTALSLGTPLELTNAAGYSALPVELLDLPPSGPPDTIRVHVRASALSPKYPVPDGANAVIDSVEVSVPMSPPAPAIVRVPVTVTLPIAAQ